jgi:hypothetical protein
MQYAESVEKVLINSTDKTREIGLFWWATEFVATKSYPKLGGHELQSFFNANGTALQIVRAFRKFGRRRC